MEIRKTNELVHLILKDKQSARNDDYTLYGFVLNYYGYSTKLPFIDVHALVKTKQVPSIETVSRCRRKVQEECPELQAAACVEKCRTLREKEFVELARGRA